MVFVREINKGGKTYRYLYKSKRVDGKVKSIYVGREEVKNSGAVHKQEKIKAKSVLQKNKFQISNKKSSSKKVVAHNYVKKDDKWIVDKIIEFNKLMEESMDFVIQNRIEAAVNHYNKLLNTYNQSSEHVGEEDKVKLYDKTKQIYDRIQELNL